MIASRSIREPRETTYFRIPFQPGPKRGFSWALQARKMYSMEKIRAKAC